MKRLIGLALFVLTALPAVAGGKGQGMDALLCVERTATRYQFKDGQWEGRSFPAAEKKQVQKLDFRRLARDVSSSAQEKIARCVDSERRAVTQDSYFVEHCYSITEFQGDAAVAEHNEMCTEFHEQGKLVSVTCRVMSFQPDGEFQSLRWQSDVSHQGQDALIYSVGTCRRNAS